MNGGPVITFSVPQPYLSALQAVRRELRQSCLSVATEVDVASRIRRELGAGVAPCRILYVDDPVLLLEAVVFNRGASLGIPQPVIVSGSGNTTQVMVRSLEAMGNGVPASAHEPLRQLHARILRTIGAVGQQEEEPALATRGV